MSSAVKCCCSDGPMSYPQFCRCQGPLTPLSDPWITEMAISSQTSSFNGNLLIAYPSYYGTGAALLEGQLAALFGELFLEAQSRVCLSNLQFSKHLTPCIKYLLLKIEWFLFPAIQSRLISFLFL